MHNAAFRRARTGNQIKKMLIRTKMTSTARSIAPSNGRNRPARKEKALGLELGFSAT